MWDACMLDHNAKIWAYTKVMAAQADGHAVDDGASR